MLVINCELTHLSFVFMFPSVRFKIFPGKTSRWIEIDLMFAGWTKYDTQLAELKKKNNICYFFVILCYWFRLFQSIACECCCCYLSPLLLSSYKSAFLVAWLNIAIAFEYRTAFSVVFFFYMFLYVIRKNVCSCCISNFTTLILSHFIQP